MYLISKTRTILYVTTFFVAHNRKNINTILYANI